ncbi:MAG: alcohol dehydrogenase AdhP [Burkholderiales bacterium]
MTSTMKAAVVRELGGPLAIEEVPVPQPSENQILVRIAATGICHTDLHAAHGDWPVKPKPPFIPGHEGVGTVVALGRAVRGVKEGDRVGIPWLHTACGYCSYCRTGWETLCSSQLNSGYSVNGSFAEYALADPAYVGRLPNALEWGPAAPILCAGVTVYKGLKETEVKPGEWVVISGIGGLGHMAVQYAKAMGMRVAAVDVHPEKLELAKSLGAEIVLDARAADVAGEMQRLVHGTHGALVTAVSPKAFEQAFGMLRSRGTMSLVGLPPGSMSLPIFDMVLKRITVRGSIVGTRQDLEEALAFAGTGAVSAHFSWDKLENINDIFARMEQGKIDGRIVVRL